MTDHIQDDPVRLRHKSLGLASFVTAIVGVVLFLSVLTLNPSTPTSTIKPVIGLVVAVGLAGVGMGIVGAVDKAAKKVFPVLGIVVSAATIIMSLLIYVSLSA
jgi:hypothetical protein